MSEELMDTVAAAEQSALMAEAYSLYPKAYEAAGQVKEAANDRALAEALDDFADLASEMSCTVALVDDPDVSVHAEFMEQISRVARAASRYFAACSSCDVSMEPAFKQEFPHIHKALDAVQTRAQEVMKDSGQGTAVSLFASIVHAGLTPSRWPKPLAPRSLC